MSLASPYSEVYYAADGVTTSFAFGQNFTALNQTDVKCIIYFEDGTSCVPTFNVDVTTGYITIITLTKPDGTVLTVPPVGSTVRVFRDTPEAQNITASQLQNYTAKQLEKIFDAIVAMIQENTYTTEHKTVRLTETQRDVFLAFLKEVNDDALLYWDNETKTIVPTDFVRQDVVRMSGGLFFRMKHDAKLRPYLEWSINGQTDWHSLNYLDAFDTAEEAKQIAEEAKEIAEDAKDTADDAKEIAEEAKEIAEGAGKVDDVRVNSVSVVENKIANITIEKPDWTETDSTKLNYILHKPTNVSDFTNDANYQNALQVGASITTAIGEHNTASDAHSNILTPIKADITDIQALIPSAATSSNQLADKEFVNSSIATSTATFRGTYNSLPELEAQTADKEDYGFVITTDAAGNTLYNRYKYNGTSWLYEYTLNNSSFTAAQWAAINSGVSQSMVDNYLSPTSSAATAYTNRISAVESGKVDKTSTANRLYGTNASGAQTTWQAGDNIELGTDGKINVVGVQQQMFEMPEATADLLGSIVQYLGEDDGTYVHGVMYQCVPVYGSFTVTSVGINNVTLDEPVFENSFLYDSSIPSYTFEYTRGGLRQTWLLPNGQSWMGNLMDFGIDYMGRPTVGATITLSRSVVGYAWGAYAGVTAGNDKIKIVGEKISGVNVVGQYNQTTMPAARAELAGKIIQFNGQGDLLSRYVDGHFYRCEENRTMRSYTLEADPMKYSTLLIDNRLALEDFMATYDNPVTFMWQGEGRGWIEEESMSMLGTEDLTQYGITYTLESGQTLEVGDKITINFTTSYTWHMIPVQDGVEVSNYLPEASSEYVDRVLLLNNVLNGSLPEPESLGVDGKLYTCVEIYNETTGDFEYEWQALPYQFNLLQYTELPSNPTKVYTGQCIQYVGASQLWNKYAEDVYLEKGHIYRATIVDEDDPDFAEVRYVDAHPYQMVVMPDPIAAYAGVITQYVGTTGTFTNGHFYKCVPTGQMTGPSDKYKKPADAEWTVSIDPDVLATQVSDPSAPFKFEFRSQAEGADWVLKVNDTTWQTVNIANYGITITGTVPYGSELKVKYIEPQPEYEWQEITVQQGGGGGVEITYDATTKTITFA